MRMELKISEKYTLTVEEAAEYFHIGTKKIREMANNNPNSKWVLWNGTHLQIKRILFEKFLDTINYV